MSIHPTAIIHPDAKIHESVSIGAFSIVGAQAKIGPNTVIGSHVLIEGDVEIGESNELYHGAVIGTCAQDKSYKGAPASVRIGNQNIIREYVTIHRATKEHSATQVGDRNYVMAYAHVGHDCVVADDVVMANSVHLGGHVKIGNGVFVGGMVAFHQFVRIGEKSMIGGFSRITRDVPPYALVQGNPARLSGINAVGLKRAGMSQDRILSLRKAYQSLFFKKGIFREHLQELESEGIAEIDTLKSFLESTSRGVIMRKKNV